MIHEDVVRTHALIDSYNVSCAQEIGEETYVSEYWMQKLMEPEAAGYYKGFRTDPAKLKESGDEYCRLKGYDPETGIPTRKELERLGLKDVADRLEKTAPKREVPVEEAESGEALPVGSEEARPSKRTK